jgi:predicted enzyme related to lactoylglutathione lyase
MKAVGYCRAEPDSTTAAPDLAEQRDVVASEIARRGWSLVDVFEDVAGGQSLNGRDGLDRALGAVESRAARALVVTDMARLCTDFDGISWLLQSGRRRNWALVAIREDIDTTEASTRPLLALADGLVPVIAYVTFDCAQPEALADFWAAATGFRKESSPVPDQYAVLSNLSGRGPALWFNKVPEPKVVKNRVHVCLNSRSIDDEAERLIALGAQKAAVHSSSSGKTWIVMRDPEGNEFCLVPASRTT